MKIAILVFDELTELTLRRSLPSGASALAPRSVGHTPLAARRLRLPSRLGGFRGGCSSGLERAAQEMVDPARSPARIDLSRSDFTTPAWLTTRRPHR